MKEPEFWPRAWEIRRALTSAPDATDAQALVEGLKHDWNLQWFAFADAESIEASWLGKFSEHGLLLSPPEVERRGSNISARGWPTLRFLKLRAEDYPTEVAGALESFESDNWWVVADSLDIAASLPRGLAEPLIVRFLNLWASTPVSWMRADLLTDAMSRLVGAADADRLVRQAVFLVANRVLTDSQLEYEYEETISPWLLTTPPTIAPAVLDGIEAALAARRAEVRLPSARRLGLRSESGGLLLDTWKEALDREPLGSTLLRAVRLYDSSSASRRSMGLRALDRVLQEGPELAGSLEMLERCASDLEREDDWSVRASLVEVVAHHFDHLGVDTSSSLLKWGRAQAASEERRDRYDARDLLLALEDAIGPEDRLVLQNLIEELGAAPTESDLPIGVASVVRPESAVPLDDLLRMNVNELRGVIQHPPVASGTSFFGGPSLEGLGTVLRACIQARFDVLLPDLAILAGVVQDTTIAHSLVSGAREAVRAGNTPDGGQAHLLAFAEEMSRVVNGWVEAGITAEPLGYGVQSVTRGLADLLEAAEEWLFTERAPLGSRITQHLEWLLDSPDPSDDYEREYGGANMDPPTLAINSTRGSALLAGLKFLSLYWGTDGAPRDELTIELERVVQQVAIAERSPAVRSGLGMYLSQVVTYWPSLLDGNEAELLPIDDNDAILWEAVFATHIRFQQPFRLAARRLREHFELAVERVASERCPYLASSAERLITHLIVLAMPRADDADEWQELLFRALEHSPSGSAAQALNELGHAARVERLDIPREWFEQFISRRVASLRDRRDQRDRHDELSALIALAMSVQLPVAQAVGLLVGMLEIGAKPRGRELVEYLSTTSADAPQAAATVLATAIEHGVFDRATFYPDDGLVELLQVLSVGAPEATWGLVNRLGESGLFTVEPVAHDLYGRLPADAGAVEPEPTE